MKKILYCIGCALLVCFLAGCSLLGNNTQQPTEEEKKYEIYLLASSSGYTGTYEQWLETIKGVDGTSIINVYINTSGELVITLSDGVVKNLGKVTGENGKDGQDGVSILTIDKNIDGEIIVYLSDGTTRNLGKISTNKPSSEAVSIESIELIDGELIIKLTDGTVNNLGKITSSSKEENEVIYIVDVYTNEMNEIIVKYSDGTEKVIGESESSNPKPVQQFQVSFETGTDVVYDTQIIDAYEKVRNPGDPYRKGYEFKGWYVNGEKWSFVGYLVTEDIHLVAQWEVSELYTIDFVANFNGQLIDVDAIGNAVYGEEVVLPSLDLEDIAFAGWLDASNGNVYKPDEFGTIYYTCTGSTILVAQWEVRYELIYSDGSVVYYYQLQGEDFNFPTDNNTIAWTSNGEVMVYGTINGYVNTTWYAVPAYTINYVDENGHTVLDTETIKSYYDYDATLPIPEKEGCNFEGWFDEKYEVQYHTKPIYETTLYAKFSTVANVTLDFNGGEILSRYASIDEFANEIVTLFKEAGTSDTTRENFSSTTHPNVKNVFSNYDNLVKYKWLFEFMKSEMAEYRTDDNYYKEVDELITRLINEDTDAINGSYANGRTALRQFIHLIINDGQNGNQHYNSLFADFTLDDTKARVSNVIVGFSGDYVNGGILPTPTKDGMAFVGWEDPNGNIFNGEYYSDVDVTLTAKYGYTVTYSLSLTAKLANTYDNYDTLKDAFLDDLNNFLGTSYTKQSSFIWNNQIYKFFLDTQQLIKWGKLLQYFVEVETEYEQNIDYSTHLDNNKSQYFGSQYWVDLANGIDLEEKYGSNTAPYSISFSIQSWLRSYHYIGTYNHGASYESEEVQNRLLEFYGDRREIIVTEGETIVLPNVEYDGFNRFSSWYDSEGNTYYANQEIVVDKNYVFYDNSEIYSVSTKLDINLNENTMSGLNEQIPEMVTVDSSNPVYILPIISRYGYNFDGWYDIDGNFVTELNYTSNIIVTALWSPSLYFDINLYDENSNYIETVTVPYEGKFIDYIKPRYLDGYEFLGWYQINDYQMQDEEMFYGNNDLYVKYTELMKVYLDYTGTLKPVSNSDQVKKIFLTDFYNWCLKQYAFSSEEISLEAFIGNTNEDKTSTGLWINYTGGAGNPSSLFINYNRDSMVNYMFAPSFEDPTKLTNEVLNDTQYFLNDAEMQAKWAPFMEYLNELFRVDRCWNDPNPYYVYELGRYMQSFNSVYVYVTDEEMAAVPKGYENLLVECPEGEELLEVRNLSVYGNDVLPIAGKEGYIFTGWEYEGNIYTAFTSEELNGKILTPVFSEPETIEVTPETFADVISNLSANQTLVFAPGNYVGDIEIKASNVTLKGTHEALINGTVVITADNVTIDGLKFVGDDDTSTVATIALGNVNNINIINCYFDRLYGTTDTSVYGNNRRPHIQQLSNCVSTNVVISNNIFDWSRFTATYLKMAITFNEVHDAEITYNSYVGTAYSGYHLYNSEGTIRIAYNDENIVGTVRGNGVVVNE